MWQNGWPNTDIAVQPSTALRHKCIVQGSRAKSIATHRRSSGKQAVEISSRHRHFVVVVPEVRCWQEANRPCWLHGAGVAASEREQAANFSVPDYSRPQQASQMRRAIERHRPITAERLAAALDRAVAATC